MNIYQKFKNKIFTKEYISSILLIISTFALDRITKKSIINHQLNNNSLYINDYLNFELVWNTGIGFGLLSQDANIFYHSLSLLIFLVLIFLVYIMIKGNYLEKILFSLILGGALGNFYDRLIYFAVPDFIDFHINEFHWFTFNIADIFISIGIILIIVKDLILSKK
tara:strand:- start:32 stop:529 length:498 start_codon:yes stop_codon:yes gene_type:complete